MRGCGSSSGRDEGATQAARDGPGQPFGSPDNNREQRAVRLWACPTRAPRHGWLSVQAWADSGYPRPVVAVHVPASRNIDSWGEERTTRVPAPWRPNIEFTSCDDPCRAPEHPGQFWPAGSPDDTDTESGTDVNVDETASSGESIDATA